MELVQRRSHTVSLKALKEFARKNLLVESVLRSVLLAEDDELSSQEYLAKLDTWLKVMNLEFSSEEASRTENFLLSGGIRSQSATQEEEALSS